MLTETVPSMSPLLLLCLFLKKLSAMLFFPLHVSLDVARGVYMLAEAWKN